MRCPWINTFHGGTIPDAPSTKTAPCGAGVVLGNTRCSKRPRVQACSENVTKVLQHLVARPKTEVLESSALGGVVRFS